MQPLDAHDPKPHKYCLKCSYILDRLPENRCPECGRKFSPNDPRTFRSRPVTRNRAGVIVLMYLIPLVLSLGFWATADSTKWDGGGYGMPLKYRVLVGLTQACGPLAWHVSPRPRAVLTTFTITWAVWLGIACKTPVARLPLPLHLLLATLWCATGCPIAGLVVT